MAVTTAARRSASVCVVDITTGMFLPLMYKDTVLSAVADKVAEVGKPVSVTSPLILTGTGTAVTPVKGVLTLMAAAVAIALASALLVTLCVTDKVSSAGNAARMATPLIIKSLMFKLLMALTGHLGAHLGGHRGQGLAVVVDRLQARAVDVAIGRGGDVDGRLNHALQGEGAGLYALLQACQAREVGIGAGGVEGHLDVAPIVGHQDDALAVNQRVDGADAGLGRDEVDGVDRGDARVAGVVQHGVDHRGGETVDVQGAACLAGAAHGRTRHEGGVDGGLHAGGGGFGVDGRCLGNRRGNLVAALWRHDVVSLAGCTNGDAVDDHIAGVHLLQIRQVAAHCKAHHVA
jgi:hypothetical protein